MSLQWIRVAICVAIVTSPIVSQAECIVSRRPRPVRLLGAFCGQVFTRYEDAPLDHTQLTLRGLDNSNFAEASSDSKGRFRFPTVPRGRYRVQSSEGFSIMGGFDEIYVDGVGAECRMPVKVMLGLSYPDCEPGWVADDWARCRRWWEFWR